MALLSGCERSADLSEREGVQAPTGGSSPEVVSDGDTTTEHHMIDRGDAESAVVSIAMGAGQLRLSAGEERLLDGTFVYSEPEWKPEVSYEVDGTRGQLTIRQGDVQGGRFGINIQGGANGANGSNERNEWTLLLGRDVPMDLRVDMGAGLSRLDLRGLDLSALDVSGGAGQTRIDLSGDRRRDVSATIEGGAGQLEITLPEAIGVHVEVDTSVGIIDAPGFRRDGDAYVNNAFGHSTVTMRVVVRLATGILRLSLT
jgi:hypothetical protein